MPYNIDKLKESFLRCRHDSMLFLPVFARASESVKADRLLRDDRSVEITASITGIFPRTPGRSDAFDHYSFIFKTLVFDSLVADYIWRHPEGTIINVGCGLDTTCERIDTSSVHWYDLDLPNVINLRRHFIPENEKRKFISSSFLSNGWFREITEDKHVLIFANGVYFYHSEAAIRRFFAGLCFTFPSFEMLFDVASPAGVRSMNRLIRKTGMTRGPFLKWGIDDYRTISGWNPRMKLLGNYRVFGRDRLKMPAKRLLHSLLYDALSYGYILHFRIRYDYRKF